MRAPRKLLGLEEGLIELERLGHARRRGDEVGLRERRRPDVDEVAEALARARVRVELVARPVALELARVRVVEAQSSSTSEITSPEASVPGAEVPAEAPSDEKGGPARIAPRGNRASSDACSSACALARAGEWTVHARAPKGWKERPMRPPVSGGRTSASEGASSDSASEGVMVARVGARVQRTSTEQAGRSQRASEAGRPKAAWTAAGAAKGVSLFDGCSIINMINTTNDGLQIKRLHGKKHSPS